MEVSFESLETTVRIRSTDPELGALIGELFRHFPRGERTPDLIISITNVEDGYRVESGTETIVEGVTRDKALIRTLSFINRTSVYGATPLIIHAGAVSRDGDVIAFPGRANLGKSTLVAACLLEGFDYVTDEGLLITSDAGEVKPYPKALWLSRKSRSALSIEETRLSARLDERHKSAVLPDELGARVAEPPQKLKHLVALDRNGGPLSIQRLGPGAVATHLLTNAFNRYERPVDWFHLTAELARNVYAWRLCYADATEAARYLKSHLAEEFTV